MNRKLLAALVRKFGKYHIRKGTEYCFKCPRCRDSKHRLEVNLKHGFNCFHCGWQGGIGQLRRELGVGATLVGEPPRIAEAPSKFSMPPGFTPFTGTSDILDHAFISKFLIKRLPLLSRAVELGWGYSSNPFYRDMVIIPITEGGTAVCWVARATLSGQTPKEVSPPSTVSNRSHYVYGLDDVSADDTVIIVEGIFDRERLKHFGFNAVSVMGSHVSDIQAGKILAKRPEELIILFDGDAAGKAGARASWKVLAKRASSMFWKIRIVDLPLGKDPDELTREEVMSAVGWVL